MLSVEEKAIIVAFRRHTLLPLDDCLYALQATIPRLTRSSLHRCLKRHGISQLPDFTATSQPKRTLKATQSASSHRYRRRKTLLYHFTGLATLHADF
jgi:hypothetical protein